MLLGMSILGMSLGTGHLGELAGALKGFVKGSFVDGLVYLEGAEAGQVWVEDLSVEKGKVARSQMLHK